MLENLLVFKSAMKHWCNGGEMYAESCLTRSGGSAAYRIRFFFANQR